MSTRGAILGGGGAAFFAGLGIAALAAEKQPRPATQQHR